MKFAIAVIDDGLSSETIPNQAFRHVYKNGVIELESDKISSFSHGSFCAAIIRKCAPYAEIGSIRVLDGDGMGKVDALIAALNWCAEQKIKVMNLSIGSVQPCDIPALYEAVNGVVKSGGIIIAACKNGCNVSFPASFPMVIGVRADESMTGKQFAVTPDPNGGIDFSASARHDIVLIPGEEPMAITDFNSYAAPVVTAVVYDILSSAKCGDSLSEIREELYRQGGGKTMAGKDYLETVQCFAGFPIKEKVPVVVFGGGDSKELMQGIAGKFLEDNYLPLLFSRYEENCSSECFSVPMGLFHIADIGQFDNQCHAMANFYNADIILAVVCETEMDSPEIDVVITTQELGTGQMLDTRYLYADGKDLDDLYRRLMVLLEG